ncbi:MAG: spectinomycin phosphotransferase, partial [Verrucomicrobia bacterium 21-51-4]
IVDWDDPILAPKERDLMFIGGGVANVWNKAHEEALFYKGYRHTEVDTTLLAYYRHERILEDIALYGQQLLLTTTGGQDRIQWYKDFIAQFEPQGVVEIAFKTDEDVPTT